MPEQASSPSLVRALQFESRIAYLTLILGAAAALATAYFHGWRWGAGILTGAILSWLNFRWLKQGMDALAAASVAQSTRGKAKVPLGIYFRAAFRYLLIGSAVYVIFRVLHVPVLSMIIGLCALGAAAFATGVQEILHSPD